MRGAPLLAALFNWGLRVGGYGVGMPFYFLGVVCGVITVLLCVVGLRKGEDERGGGGGGGEVVQEEGG
jgi:uncharacterized YccA/Bax inhibitor family protein